MTPTRLTQARYAPQPKPGAVPPHDIDAEAAVLSAVLLKSEALDRVASIVRPEDFYLEANGRILAAALDLARCGEPVDTVTIASALRDRGELAGIGGMPYLGQIVDATPAVSHVEAHARTVASKARLRAVIGEAQRIAAEGYTAPDADRHVEDAAAALARLADTSTAIDTLVSADVAIRATYAEIAAAADRGVPPPAIHTGLDALDRVCPLREAQLTSLAAGSAVGKTSLAVQIAGAAASHGDGVVFISLEMPTAQLMRRLSAQLACVDGWRIADPSRLTVEDWRRLTDASKRIAQMPLMVDDRPDTTPALIASTVRRAKATFAKRKDKAKLALVVVDYLQLVSGRDAGRDANREQQVSYVARELKILANREGVHVLALAQLNGDAEKAERRPRMSDLRESKAVSMHSDNVWLLHAPAAIERSERDLTSASAAPGEDVDLIFGKQRAGSAGFLRLHFWPSQTRFGIAGAHHG